MTDEKKINEDVEIVEDDGDAVKKINKLREEIKKCETERREYLEGWQRAKADYLNYRKDEGRRFEDMARVVASGFMQDILPVLDSFDVATKSGKDEGMLLVRVQLMDVLKKRGLEEIEVREGETFNPERHESLDVVESHHPAGSVAEVVQRGYTFQGRVLRPARVRIAK